MEEGKEGEQWIDTVLILALLIVGESYMNIMEYGNMEYGKEELFSYPIYCTQYFDSCCFPPYFHQLGVIWGGSIRRIKILYYKDWIVIIQYHNRNHNQIKSNRIYLDIWKWIYRLETDIIWAENNDTLVLGKIRMMLQKVYPLVVSNAYIYINISLRIS